MTGETRCSVCDQRGKRLCYGSYTVNAEDVVVEWGPDAKCVRCCPLGPEQEHPSVDDACDEDELTERRREYHDDIRADFRRLGLV